MLLARVICSVLLLATCAVNAQDSVNRVPIDDEAFSIVADHYGYDRELPLEGATIGF